MNLSQATPRRATKIVATIGPASDAPELLERLIGAGADVLRLNFSHGAATQHIARAQRIREAARTVGREVAIMADLQGPKIRIGRFEGGKAQLASGAAFILDAACELGDAGRVGLDYPDLPRDVRTGDLLLLNDGLIQLDVTKVQGSQIHTRVRIGGVLSDNKGVNRQGGGLSAPALTAKDMEDIKTALQLQADYIAVSFVRNRSDMEMARQLAVLASAGLGYKPGMIAKIERVEAIAALDEILDASDGIMVARGDLAVEVGDAAVPALQKRMIRRARDRNKLVITATQMMESMIHQASPTRAEVSDVANAVLDGTDAVMLSAETASGEYPVQTVASMAAICIEAEKSDRSAIEHDFLNARFTRIDQSIAYGALFTAVHLRCRIICALTDSGATALWMSRHDTEVPIYALTPRVATQRRLMLYRNVHALELAEAQERDAALAAAERVLLAAGCVAPDDLIALTIGEPLGQPGGTNTLKIIRVRAPSDPDGAA